MTAIEQANTLTQQAIAILLAEREQIDAHLSQLGYGQEKTVKRGRPRKTIINKEATNETLDAR
jgi:hypothetical protein